MKFGPVPIGEAQGAILAHSLRAGAAQLRKGRKLLPADLDLLRAAGISEVIVAILDPGDIGEDAAATALAHALVPDPDKQGLTLSRAATGRVNLRAAGPGVITLDPARLTALNAVDPMLTLASVPPFQQVRAGQMVGTVKVISYAVAQAALDGAIATLAGDSPAIALATPVHRSACLIVTETGAERRDKGPDAMRARLAALDMHMEPPVFVPHDEAALARAIGAASADMILILTASATSDPRDVAPQALRHAGGLVTRFGMPVDPGNLLFLGRIGARPVIGLPGCARSPALNGADWVLSRVACGIDVTAQDFAAMGVGGLLKEIPTRPQPRNLSG